MTLTDDRTTDLFMAREVEGNMSLGSPIILLSRSRSDGLSNHVVPSDPTSGSQARRMDLDPEPTDPDQQHLSAFSATTKSPFIQIDSPSSFGSDFDSDRREGKGQGDVVVGEGQGSGSETEGISPAGTVTEVFSSPLSFSEALWGNGPVDDQGGEGVVGVTADGGAGAGAGAGAGKRYTTIQRSPLGGGGLGPERRRSGLGLDFDEDPGSDLGPGPGQTGQIGGYPSSLADKASSSVSRLAPIKTTTTTTTPNNNNNNNPYNHQSTSTSFLSTSTFPSGGSGLSSSSSRASSVLINDDDDDGGGGGQRRQQIALHSFEAITGAGAGGNGNGNGNGNFIDTKEDTGSSGVTADYGGEMERGWGGGRGSLPVGALSIVRSISGSRKPSVVASSVSTSVPVSASVSASRSGTPAADDGVMGFKFSATPVKASIVGNGNGAGVGVGVGEGGNGGSKVKGGGGSGSGSGSGRGVRNSFLGFAQFGFGRKVGGIKSKEKEKEKSKGKAKEKEKEKEKEKDGRKGSIVGEVGKTQSLSGGAGSGMRASDSARSVLDISLSKALPPPQRTTPTPISISTSNLHSPPSPSLLRSQTTKEGKTSTSTIRSPPSASSSRAPSSSVDVSSPVSLQRSRSLGSSAVLGRNGNVIDEGSQVRPSPSALSSSPSKGGGGTPARSPRSAGVRPTSMAVSGPPYQFPSSLFGGGGGSGHSRDSSSSLAALGSGNAGGGRSGGGAPLVGRRASNSNRPSPIVIGSHDSLPTTSSQDPHPPPPGTNRNSPAPSPSRKQLKHRRSTSPPLSPLGTSLAFSQSTTPPPATTAVGGAEQRPSTATMTTTTTTEDAARSLSSSSSSISAVRIDASSGVGMREIFERSAARKRERERAISVLVDSDSVGVVGGGGGGGGGEGRGAGVLPPFPCSRSGLMMVHDQGEMLMKYCPQPGFSLRHKSKSFQHRYVVLTTYVRSLPDPNASSSSSIAGGGSTSGGTAPLPPPPPPNTASHLHCFKSTHSDEQELERIEITADSVVCVTDEVPSTYKHVLKMTGLNAEIGRAASSLEPRKTEEWYFGMSETAQLKNWIKAIKGILLELKMPSRPPVAPVPSSSSTADSRDPTRFSVDTRRTSSAFPDLTFVEAVPSPRPTSSPKAHSHSRLSHPFSHARSQRLSLALSGVEPYDEEDDTSSSRHGRKHSLPSASGTSPQSSRQQSGDELDSSSSGAPKSSIAQLFRSTMAKSSSVPHSNRVSVIGNPTLTDSTNHSIFNSGLLTGELDGESSSVPTTSYLSNFFPPTDSAVPDNSGVGKEDRLTSLSPAPRHREKFSPAATNTAGERKEGRRFTSLDFPAEVDILRRESFTPSERSKMSAEAASLLSTGTDDEQGTTEGSLGVPHRPGDANRNSMGSGRLSATISIATTSSADTTGRSSSTNSSSARSKTSDASHMFAAGRKPSLGVPSGPPPVAPLPEIPKQNPAPLRISHPFSAPFKSDDGLWDDRRYHSNKSPPPSPSRVKRTSTSSRPRSPATPVRMMPPPILPPPTCDLPPTPVSASESGSRRQSPVVQIFPSSDMNHGHRSESRSSLHLTRPREEKEEPGTPTDDLAVASNSPSSRGSRPLSAAFSVPLPGSPPKGALPAVPESAIGDNDALQAASRALHSGA